MPLTPAICLQSLRTHFDHFKTSLHLAGLTRLPHLPHACAPQWVPIVWHVPTGPLYMSASCSTVYKSSPLARESLEFSLWISFARLVVLCTYVAYAYKNFRYPLLVSHIVWNIRLPLHPLCPDSAATASMDCTTSASQTATTASTSSKCKQFTLSASLLLSSKKQRTTVTGAIALNSIKESLDSFNSMIECSLLMQPDHMHSATSPEC